MRLFVAIELPQDVKDALLALETSIPTARWVKPEQLHLTLRFIGEVDSRQNNAIQAALGTICPRQTTLRMRKVGRFPGGKKKPPRILWAGMEKNPVLLELQAQVEKAVVQAGIAPEKRPFSPHITLARLKLDRNVSAVDRFLEQHQHFKTDAFPVDRFVLFSSILSPQGARYQVEAAYHLTDPN